MVGDHGDAPKFLAWAGTRAVLIKQRSYFLEVDVECEGYRCKFELFMRTTCTQTQRLKTELQRLELAESLTPRACAQPAAQTLTLLLVVVHTV